jgi:hypothetical protein
VLNVWPPARHELAMVPVNVREGAEPIELQLEQPVGVVEAFLDPQQGHRPELHVCQLLRWLR